MKNIFLLFIVISISLYHLKSQELFYPEIEKELSDEQKELFDDAVKILQKASGNENNANSIDLRYAKKRGKPDWDEKTWEAKQQRIMAEKNYAKAYTMISDVYSDIITNAGYRSSSDEATALSLNKDAKSKFSEAKEKLSSYSDISRGVMETTDYESVLTNIKASHDLKISGIRDQISALEIFERGVKKQQDEEDVASWQKAVTTNSIDAYYEYLNNNPRGKYMAQANNKIREIETSTGDLATANNKKNNSRYNTKNTNNENVTNGTEVNNNNTNTENNNETNETNNTYDRSKLVFKVQIAASTTVVTDWVLKHKAPGIDLIEEYRSNMWNKYVVGNFRSYREAAILRDKIKNTAPDAFIVVFEKNKQIPVTAEMKK